MITDYTDQKWRLLTAPLEGIVWLPVVSGSLICKYTSRLAAGVTGISQRGWKGTVATSRLIVNTWFLGDEDQYSAKDTRGYSKQIVHFAYTNITMVTGTERLDGGGKLEEVERPFKFYEKGLTQAIVAFVLVPIVLLIGMWTTMKHPDLLH